MKFISTNILISLIMIMCFSIIFLVVIPTTVNYIDLQSNDIILLKSFRSQDTEVVKDNKSVTILGIEFEDSTKVIEVFSRIIGTILSFTGVAWSIYVWKHARKFSKSDK